MDKELLRELEARALRGDRDALDQLKYSWISPSNKYSWFSPSKKISKGVVEVGASLVLTHIVLGDVLLEHLSAKNIGKTNIRIETLGEDNRLELAAIKTKAPADKIGDISCGDFSDPINIKFETKLMSHMVGSPCMRIGSRTIIASQVMCLDCLEWYFDTNL